MLVLAIVVAATAAVFVFSKKASVTAAVETEQHQVEEVVKTVNGLFATQRNFSALGTDGASYLQAHAARAGLKLTTDAHGSPALQTHMGGGHGTLTLASADVGFAGATVAPGTANGFVLAYDGLAPAECIGLVTATAASTVKTKVGHGGALPAEGVGRVALRGRLEADKGAIAADCQAQAGTLPTVFLFFAPARAVSSAAAGPTPAPTCNPTHEVQYTACPAGQVGTVTQQRDGTCTGAGGALVYTIWTTTDTTCQAEPVAPPTQTTVDPGEQCGPSVFTRSVACPAGQIGQIAQRRDVNTCTGTDTGWQVVAGGNACQPAPAAPTCTPSTAERTVACPAGQGGQIVQTRSATCANPTAAPTWSAWVTTSNTCTASCVVNGTCCVVKRATQTVVKPCAAGTYGAAGEDQERFLGCVNAMTQSGSWTPWVAIANNGSCTACPATTSNTKRTWQNRSQACPAGETGSITWQAEQIQTQSVSYSCPAGTTILPAPTMGAWSSATDTGATRNRVENCTPVSGSCAWDFSGGNEDNLGTSGNIPGFWNYRYSGAGGSAEILCQGDSGASEYPVTCSGSGAIASISGSYSSYTALSNALGSTWSWMTGGGKPGNAPATLLDPSASVFYDWRDPGSYGYGSVVEGSGTAVPNSACVPASPITGGYVVIMDDWAGEDTACHTSTHEHEVDDAILAVFPSYKCTQAQFGLSEGGEWCEPSGTYVINGAKTATCVYKAGIQGAGSIVSGAKSTNTDYLDLGTLACSSYPSFTFDQAITYEGKTYRVKGSCPSPGSVPCTATSITAGATGVPLPGGTGYGLAVSWPGVKVNPTATVSDLRFSISISPTTTGCSSNPSGTGVKRVSANWTHYEAE
jgi:hypothetical protein